MEWMAEKATEVGWDEVSFLDTQFSERRSLRADRIDKIVVAAMKQSRKAWKPVVNEMTSFRAFVDAHQEGRRFICHCYPEIAARTSSKPSPRRRAPPTTSPCSWVPRATSP